MGAHDDDTLSALANRLKAQEEIGRDAFQEQPRSGVVLFSTRVIHGVHPPMLMEGPACCRQVLMDAHVHAFLSILFIPSICGQDP